MPFVVRITNVTSQAQTGCSIDLFTLAKHGRNTEFNPVRSPFVFICKKGPYKSTAKVSAHGKVMFMGAVSETHAKKSARMHLRHIQRTLGHACVRFLNFRITNVCATVQFDQSFRLVELHRFLPMTTTYDPEISGGLRFRIGRVAFVLHATGKAIVSGAKTEQEIYNASLALETMLYQ